MSFETQFATAQSLVKGSPATRETLMKRYFNVAFLPFARDEFLSRVFQDRDTQWIKQVLSLLGDELKKRVIALLPPMQARMLEGAWADLSYGESLKSLRTLNDEFAAKMDQGDLTADEIFAFTPPKSENRLRAAS
jgi:hypothetical protein